MNTNAGSKKSRNEYKHRETKDTEFLFSIDSQLISLHPIRFILLLHNELRAHHAVSWF